MPPTSTPVPPTSTPVPPTSTPVPPTSTPVPPTSTPVPPTSTPVPSAPVIANMDVSAGRTAATVDWTTDIPADSVVRYGMNGATNLVASDPALTSSHVVRVERTSSPHDLHLRRGKHRQRAHHDQRPGDLPDEVGALHCAHRPPRRPALGGSRGARGQFGEVIRILRRERSALGGGDAIDSSSGGYSEVSSGTAYSMKGGTS